MFDVRAKLTWVADCSKCADTKTETYEVGWFEGFTDEELDGSDFLFDLEFSHGWETTRPSYEEITAYCPKCKEQKQ